MWDGGVLDPNSLWIPSDNCPALIHVNMVLATFLEPSFKCIHKLEMYKCLVCFTCHTYQILVHIKLQITKVIHFIVYNTDFSITFTCATHISTSACPNHSMNCLLFTAEYKRDTEKSNFEAIQT